MNMKENKKKKDGGRRAQVGEGTAGTVLITFLS